MKRIMTAVFLVLLVPLVACAGFFGGSGVHTHQSSASGGNAISQQAAIRSYVSCAGPSIGTTGPVSLCTTPTVSYIAGDLIVASFTVGVTVSTGYSITEVSLPTGVAAYNPISPSACRLGITTSTDTHIYCELRATADGSGTFGLSQETAHTVSPSSSSLNVRVLRGGAP